MFTTLTKKTILIAAASTMLIFSACENKEKKGDAGYSAITPSTCGCEADWFPHEKTPDPMEGKGSPFDTSSTSNCIFHQWSWQKFLWLTRALPNGHAFFQDGLMQVDAKLSVVTPYNGITLVLEDTAQAGSGGSLRTNPVYAGVDTNYLVHYSIFVNNKLMDAAIAFKKLIVSDPNKLTNDSVFPIGALELKVSWVNVNAIAATERTSYYTTEAVIKTIKNKDTVYTKTKVALLGMHVVGRVINHPEFIWATFEHHKMAPMYNWASTTATQDAPITSADDKLLFGKGSTTTLAGITWNTTAPDSMYRVFTLYKYGTPRVALDSFMQGTSQSGVVNYSNIDSLNACVAKNLNPADVWINYFYNGSIWVNTDGLTPTQQAQLISAEGDTIGNGEKGAIARGSLNAFNITMETYVQTGLSDSTNNIHTGNVSDLTNCFSCHTAAPSSLKFEGVTYKNKVSPLYVSHIFRNYVGSTPTTTLKDAKLQGVRDFLLKRTKQGFERKKK